MDKKRIVVIVSGGMDSVTLLHDLYKNEEYEVVGTLTFNYGQKHKKEIEYAKKNCKKFKLDWHEVNLKNLQNLLASSLTSNIEVPEGHYADENMKSTVVPSRNLIMLSIASGYAISKGAQYIAYGAHGGDHTIYPDCRPEFIDKLNEVTKVANFEPVEILAPYTNITKVEILEKGLKLGVNYKDTWTCYKGKLLACGKCGSCQERLEAFEKNGIKDPLEYDRN